MTTVDNSAQHPEPEPRSGGGPYPMSQSEPAGDPVEEARQLVLADIDGVRRWLVRGGHPMNLAGLLKRAYDTIQRAGLLPSPPDPDSVYEERGAAPQGTDVDVLLDAIKFTLAALPVQHPEPCGTDACWLCAAETTLREALRKAPVEEGKRDV